MKKIVVILMLLLTQQELSAQANNSTNAHFVDVSVLNSPAENSANSKELTLTPQIYPIDPDFILRKDSVLNKDVIIYDPKLVDIKPQ